MSVQFLTPLALAMTVAAGAWTYARPAEPQADRLCQRGYDLTYNLDFPEAIATFQQAITAQPKDPAAYRGVATATWLSILFQRGLVTVDDYEGRVTTAVQNVPEPPAESPEQAVVDGIDWVIRPNEWWIVGALPGGGKSGLLATAAGLLRPLKGMQKLCGREVGENDGDALAAERLRIGHLFGEGGRVFRNLTVAENVALPWCYHRDCTPAEADDELARLLDLVGLSFIAHVPASRLSPSWRLRTALARALIVRPEVLFMDNPLLGLDLRHKQWWLEFLDVISSGHPFYQGRPLTLVVATYDVHPWLKEGRQFALLKEKRWTPLGAYRAETGFDDPLWRELLAESKPAR